MSLNFDPLKKWFGHDRRERRASFILLIIIAVVFFARFLVPVKSNDLKDLTADLAVRLQAEQEKRRTGSADSGKTVSQPGAARPWQAKYEKKPRGGTVIRKKSIELNSCDSIELESLPGIGKVLSKRIIRYRNLLGGFVSVDQMREVYGLPPETFELIKNRVYADTVLVRKISVNTASARDLSRLPYLKNYDVKAILEYRKVSGKISGVKQLISNKVITPEIAIRVKGYLDFR